MVIVLAIGKTILILLLVIVCILAAVLFCPVRYEIEADLEEKRADVRVNWLLKIIRFRFRAGDGMRAVLSILFFKIDFTDPEAKKKRAAKKAKRDAKKAAKARRKREKKRRGAKKAANHDDSAQETFEIEKKAVPQNSDIPPNSEKQGEEFAGQTFDSAAGNMTAKKSSIGDKISNAAGAVRDAAGKVGEAKDKVTGFGKTARRMIGLVKKYEVLDIALPKLVRFLKRIRPRKLSGFVGFGLEDPAATGKIVGALAMVPLFYETEFRMLPDFETEETYVKGRIDTKGYILLIWIVLLAVGLVKEKKIRQFVSDLRHGGEP